MKKYNSTLRSFDGVECPGSSVLIESLEGRYLLPHGDAGLHVVIDRVVPIEYFLRG
jgi:hypothetical protein